MASFAVGNEPDWHAYHNYPGHPLDPAIHPAGGGGYVINPMGYGIKAFRLGSAGQVKPA